jgi:hypothetical protein
MTRRYQSLVERINTQRETTAPRKDCRDENGEKDNEGRQRNLNTACGLESRNPQRHLRE